MSAEPTKRAGGPPAGALLSVAFAAVVGAGAWYWFGRAADAGVQRLARLDAVRTYCDRFYGQALDRTDTMRVDRAPLPDTIDPGSKDAFDRCGDLRALTPEVPRTLPNPRELDGKEMPRGLR